jgi:predicted RNA-binding protein with EMAP domain
MTNVKTEMVLIKEMEKVLQHLKTTLPPQKEADENDFILISQTLSTLAEAMGTKDYNEACCLTAWLIENKKSLKSFSNTSDYYKLEKETRKTLRGILEQEDDCHKDSDLKNQIRLYKYLNFLY